MRLLLRVHVLACGCLVNLATISQRIRGSDGERCSKEREGQGTSVLQTASYQMSKTFIKDDPSPKTIPSEWHISVTGPCHLCDFTDIVENVRDLKFYTQLSGKTCDNTADSDAFDNVLNQKKIDPESNPLNASGDWLWAINDGDSDSYMQHRLTCHHSLVNSPEEADLCYPSCEPTPILGIKQQTEARGWGEQCFEVPERNKASWSECSQICLRNELYDEDPEQFGPDAFGRCLVEVPYVTGISWPPPRQNIHALNAPWMVEFPRTTMLAFVGAKERGSVGGKGESWEGAVKRSTILDEMRSEAKNINPNAPETLFSTRIIKGADLDWDWDQVGPSEQFWLDAWGLYASANFSWQPHGDTATRRALYDGLLFGSIPVVDVLSFNAYRRLFNGKLWRGTRVEDVFVVIPEGKETDGHFIIQTLLAMPPEEVDLRRSRLQQLASALQWSAHTPGGADAFLLALGMFRS